VLSCLAHKSMTATMLVRPCNRSCNAHTHTTVLQHKALTHADHTAQSSAQYRAFAMTTATAAAAVCTLTAYTGVCQLHLRTWKEHSRSLCRVLSTLWTALQLSGTAANLSLTGELSSTNFNCTFDRRLQYKNCMCFVCSIVQRLCTPKLCNGQSLHCYA
jgi:hypothetical protein